MRMNKLKSNTEQRRYIYFKPTDIKPKDDAFHGSLNFLDIEWWYFDAVLEGGYSLHVGIRTFHIKKQGIVKSRIEVYKNGKILVEAVKTDPFNKFHISDEIPLIELKEEIVKALIPLNPEKIILFGSYAYGTPNEDSDIDICVVEKDYTNKWEEKLKIRNLLNDIRMPIDILNPKGDEYMFYKEEINSVYYDIDKKGIVLWQNS